MAAQQYNFRKIGLEEGLPALAINDMIEGPRGFYWLASEGGGLLRYDGYEFQSIRNEEQPIINALSSDSTGIWYSAEGELSRYDGYNFRDIPLPGELRIIDLEYHQQLYMLSSAGKIYRLEQEQLLALESPAAVNFKNLLVYRGQLYALSGNEFWQVKEGLLQKAQLNVPHLFKNFPATNFSAHGDELLAWGNEELAWLKPAGPQMLSPARGLPRAKINFAYSTSGGSLVLGTSQGLAILDNQALALLPTPDHQIYSVLAHQGQIIAGTAGGAIIFRDSVLHSQLSRPGLVLALAENKGDLFLGSERGLYRYHKGQLNEIKMPGRDFVFSLLAEGENIWVGSGQGILRIRKGKLEPVGQDNKLPQATIFSIAQAADGSLWFGSYLQGFFRLHQGQFTQLREMAGFRLDSIRFSSFLPVSAQEVWLGTQNNGLYHLKGNEVEHYDFAAVNYSEVRALEIVPNCAEPGSRQIWLGTNKGLLPLQEVIERKNNNSRAALTFIGNPVLANALRYHQGKLLAGTEKGVQILEVCDFLQAHKQPRPVLQDVRLFMGEQPGLNSFAEDSLPFSALPLRPELPYDKNYLNFSYSAQELMRPDEIFYRYRLLGQEESWTMAGNRREALFTNLSPGKYKFEVQARRPGLPWKGPGFEYAFKIRRPYYGTWWFISAIVLLTGGLTFLFISDRIKRLNQRLKLENALLEMERKALRLQMNPHFIFNALDSISSFIFKKDPKQAVRYLNNFAKLMRLTLESSMEHIHPVETEVSILKNYLELEKLRFGKQFDFEIELDEEIDYDVGLPPMLVQPHVENAILHGLKPKPEPGFLKISFKLEDDLLCVVVDDNGIGRKAAKNLPNRKAHRSMATQINKDRLRLLKNSLSDKVNLEIIDKKTEGGEAAGTTVIIRLPAEEI